MKNISLRAQLTLAFGLVAVIFAISTLTCLRGLRSSMEQFAQYRALARTSLNIGQLEAHFGKMRSAHQAMELGDKSAAAQYEENVKRATQYAEATRTVLAAEGDPALGEKLAASVAEADRIMRDIRQAQQNGNSQQAETLSAHWKELAHRLDETIDTVGQKTESEQNELGPRIQDSLTKAVTSSSWSSGIAFAVTFVVSVFIILSINKILRRLVLSLEDSADHTAEASEQISSSSQSLAEAASEQAASLEETSASLEELSSMTRRNAENALSGTQKAKTARDMTDRSAASMQQLDSAMSEISAIVKSIDEIAFQTNILALNAAVEAARAGDAGAGFAVVADEVRNLARRSADAAKETAAKIQHGVQLSTQVSGNLRSMVDHVREVDSIVADISTASTEQTQGIEQITLAVAQIDKVTQNTASQSEETAGAARQMTLDADTLRKAVLHLAQVAGMEYGSAPETSPRETPPPSTKNSDPIERRVGVVHTGHASASTRSPSPSRLDPSLGHDHSTPALPMPDIGASTKAQHGAVSDHGFRDF
jgi:methyl-accepting chemotaxis protein